jgi:hypothetical protein
MKSLVVIFFGLICFATYAQDTAKAVNVKSESRDWQFRVGPYYWFANIEGSLERPPVPSNLPEEEHGFEINMPYDEFQNALKFAFLVNTEYHNKKWMGVLNVTSFILEGEAITPKEILLKDSEYRLTMAFGEALVGYEVVSKKKFMIYGLAGAKVIYNDITAKAIVGGKNDFSGERDGFWVEPVVGVKVKYIPTPRIECMAYADYGPIRTKEELTNQFILNVNFLLNKWLYVAPGYRYWLFRVSKEEAIFNGTMKGFFIRIGGQF